MRRARCGGEFSDVRQHVVEVPHGEANERNRLKAWHLVGCRRMVDSAPTVIDERRRRTIGRAFCEPTVAPLACDRREFVEDAPADAQRPVRVPPGGEADQPDLVLPAAMMW